MNRFRFRGYKLAAPLIALILLIGGVTALTVGASSHSDTIYACVTGNTGVLYRVGTTEPERCNAGDTLISWSASGGGLSWQGEWDDSATYNEGDAVQHNGGSWISTTENNTGTPGIDGGWDLLAAKGADGTGSGSGSVSVTTVVVSGASTNFAQTLTASCGSGFHVVGGGASSEIASRTAHSFPSSTTGVAAGNGTTNPPAWSASFPGGGSSGINTVYALCVQSPGPIGDTGPPAP